MDLRKHDVNEWKFLKYDAMSYKTIWFRRHGDSIQIRETIPDWLAYQIIEQNKREAKEWSERGGWKATPKGAVVAKIPLIIDNEIKRRCGYDPLKSGWYDKDKYNRFLDDSDYSNFRTGGGKIGKNAKARPFISSLMKQRLAGG